MERRKNTQSSSGFTIVEVLIVFAIAGMIALAIFQALPALSRSSRNGQRKNGVASVLRAVSHYELNNSASMPAACTGGSCFGSGTFTDKQSLIYYDGTRTSSITVCVGDYSSGSLTYTGAGCSAVTAVTDTESVSVYNYQRCDTARPGAVTTAGAGYSNVVALYALEGGNSAVSQCQEL